VGVPLLERTTRQVTLTAAGEVFLAECRMILAGMDTAVRKARKAAEQQRVTIAVRPAAGPGVLPALLAADGVLTDIVFTYDEVSALRDGTADIALMCQTTAVPGLELMELGLEHPVVLLPAGHPLADRPFLTLTEVEALPGYEARLPNEAMDAMVDRVALGRRSRHPQRSPHPGPRPVATVMAAGRSCSLGVIRKPIGRAVMSTDASSLTTEDLEFLQRPLHGFLSVAAGPIPAQPRPVWFEATADGTVQLFTGPDTLKVRRLRRDPRASIVVAAPVEERERWVSIAGSVTVELDGAYDLASRLAARYWDLDDPTRAADLAGILAEDQVRLVIHPETVHRYVY